MENLASAGLTMFSKLAGAIMVLICFFTAALLFGAIVSHPELPFLGKIVLMIAPLMFIGLGFLAIDAWRDA